MINSAKSLPLALMRQIGKTCDQFESDWVSGQQPRIEDFLESADTTDRPRLLRSLLELELELIKREGTTPSWQQYGDRFPDYHQIVSTVFTAFQESSLGKTPDGSGAKSELRTVFPTLLADIDSLIDAVKNSTASETIPNKIGRFEVLATLGEGGFGTVYRARDPQLEREVALKVPHTRMLRTEHDIERFLREARTTATLRHANICPIYEVGEAEGRYFLVMAYIAGKSLAAILRDRKILPQPEAASIVRTMARALQAAHSNGVIHRDLKPDNVMVEAQTGDLFIMDFGLARRCNAEDTRLTLSGQILGTPAYMPPEQARGRINDIGPASDTYSLGIILYELLCGQRPYRGTMADVMVQILRADPVSPSKHQPQLDRRLEEICLKAISKRIVDRFQTMDSLADALSGFLDQRSTEPEKPIPLKIEQYQQRTNNVSTPRDDRSDLDFLECQKQRVEDLRRQGCLDQAIECLEGIVELTDSKAQYYVEWARHEIDRIKTEPNRRIRETQLASRAVRQLIDAHDYERALLVLQKVPDDCRNDEFSKLWDETLGLSEEVRALQSDIDTLIQSTSTDELIPKLERFIQLKPNDQKARELYDQLGNAGGVQTVWKRQVKWSMPRHMLMAGVGIVFLYSATSLVLYLVGQLGMVVEDEAARWVLSVGGSIHVVSEGHQLPIHVITDLPDANYHITRIDLRSKAVGMSHLVGTTLVHDADLEHLSGLKKLMALDLSDTQTVDTGLTYLRKLTSLRVLNLGNTHVTDSGLRLLTDLTELRQLYLKGARVTKQGVAQLKTALPKCYFKR